MLAVGPLTVIVVSVAGVLVLIAGCFVLLVGLGVR
jgi:hypothetical protein